MSRQKRASYNPVGLVQANNIGADNSIEHINLRLTIKQCKEMRLLGYFIADSWLAEVLLEACPTFYLCVCLSATIVIAAKRCKIDTLLLWNTYRKSVSNFQNPHTNLTLDDPLAGLFQGHQIVIACGVSSVKDRPMLPFGTQFNSSKKMALVPWVGHPSNSWASCYYHMFLLSGAQNLLLDYMVSRSTQCVVEDW